MWDKVTGANSPTYQTTGTLTASLKKPSDHDINIKNNY
jgi:hypothetical protein